MKEFIKITEQVEIPEINFYDEYLELKVNVKFALINLSHNYKLYEQGKIDSDDIIDYVKEYYEASEKLNNYNK